MATTINARDVLLQAAATRFAVTPNIVSLYPALTDVSWGDAAAINSVTDGQAGTAVRRGGSTQTFLAQTIMFPIDRSRTYRTRFWARAAAGTNGTLYFCLQQYLSGGGTGPTNQGRDPYQPSNVAAHTNWVEYSFTWSSAHWQTGVTQVLPYFILNLGGSAGYWEVQDFQMTDVSEVVKAQADATTAAANALTALNALTSISSDGVLDRSEKAAVAREFDEMAAEFNELLVKADSLGVSRVAFYNSKVALNDYLAGIGANNVWRNTSVDSSITRTDFNTAFKNYYDQRGLLYNALTAKAATTASGVSLSATGILTGPGGSQGQMTALPTLDLGDGTHFGARNRNDAPSEYPVGMTKQFKTSSVLGLASGDGTFTTLETTKQYTDATGGGVYQYAFQGLKTWRRTAPSAVGDAATWTAWVQDLDRNAYTGDLAATKNLTLVPRGVTLEGNSITKPSTAASAWDADAYSRNSHTGGIWFTCMVGTLGYAMMGLNDDPATNSHFNTIDFSMETIPDGTLLALYDAGATQHASTTYAVGDILGMSYDGVNLRWYKNGVQFGPDKPAILGSALFFDCSLYTPGMQIKDIQLGPMSNNQFSAIGGANKPQDGATVGAPAGTLVGSTPATTIESRANAAVVTPTGFAVTPTITGTTSNASNTSVHTLSRGVSVSVAGAGGSGVTYAWAINMTAGSGTIRISSTTSASATVSCTAQNVSTSIAVTCTVTDNETGLSRVVSGTVTLNFGAY